MKASLIIKLIEAHCSGQELMFENALKDLIADEERKGNIPLAQSLKISYQPSKNSKQSTLNDHPSLNSSFISQGALANFTPRDRESLLELYDVVYPSVKLDDVILPNNQKDIIIQVIEEQKNLSTLLEQGLQPTNRLLLCGTPGCGKTMTAMAIANELKLPMAYVRLDGLVSSFLGQTSTNLRKVFDSVKNSKIILFLDEFDAIAKKRDDAHELGELKRVVTTLLQNFDNLPPNVFLIAATNHQHLLDSAIWRRFNISINLNLPDYEQRKILLRNFLQGYKISSDIDINLLARVIEGLSPSQIKDIITITAKSVFIADRSSDIKTEHLLNTVINQTTLYSKENSEEFWLNVKQLKRRGISLRVLERALGVPKSTLSDKLKEGEIYE